MYESPITRYTEDIMTDIVKKEEGYLVESVHKVGFNIDKEELAKALRYDRDQYEKGFNDGRLSAESHWIPCEGRCPEKSGDYLVTDDCKNIYVNEWHCLLHKWQYDDSRIIAWMPLPAPWEGGAEDA